MRALRGRVAGQRRQSERPSDALADVHHGRHDAAVGPLAVPVRRRGAPRLCVHDARRHRQRHLVHGVHRLGDRDEVERPQGGASPGRNQACGGRSSDQRIATRGEAGLKGCNKSRHDVPLRLSWVCTVAGSAPAWPIISSIFEFDCSQCLTDGQQESLIPAAFESSVGSHMFAIEVC